MGNRSLLGKLSYCAWTCILAEVRRLLRRDDVVPGMVAAMQTHGELLHWHPHLHMLLTCGAFTPTGNFVKLPELDLDRLEAAWQTDTDTDRKFDFRRQIRAYQEEIVNSRWEVVFVYRGIAGERLRSLTTRG